MTITRPCHCTREAVQRALDFAETARTDEQVDRAIEAASDDVEGFLHRRFYPQLTTRSFDWPDRSYSRPWRLWLGANELISITSLTTGGVTLSPDSYFLRRSDYLDEPPYNSVELDLSGSATFGGGATPQRDVRIAGLYGYSANEAALGTLVTAINAAAVGVDLSAAGSVGVGDLVRIDDERMLVTDRSMLDTGQDLAGDLNDSDAATLVPAPNGTATSGEVILIDAERMLVIDVAGDNLVVKRGWDGTVLSSHTSGANVYAARALTVQRGVCGTTAASHSLGAPVVRHVYPALVRDLSVAEAIDQLLQETAGYARAGSVQDNSHNGISVSNIRSTKDQLGLGLDSLRSRAYTAYGRQARKSAV
ncbi:MAG: hypothetical protein ACRDP6_42180 [Actinoallomurus sp.]